MSDATTKTREPYKLVIDNPEFNPIGEYKLISSTELGQIASSLFKTAFADFEGVLFVPGNGTEPTLSLIFNHGKYGDDEVVGVKRAVEIGSNDSDSVIDRVRKRDRLYRDGDKFLVTEDGKDVITGFLTPNCFNNGKPKWNQIVSEYSESSNYYYYNSQVPQYTMVSGISLKKLVAFIFGRNNTAKGDKYDYEVIIKGVIGGAYNQQPTSSSNYMLQISRASEKEVKDVCRKLGFDLASSNIIRTE